MVIADLDELVAREMHREIREGDALSRHHVLSWEGREIFYKRSKPMSFTRRMVKKIRLFDYYLLSLLTPLERNTMNESVEKEVRTLEAWRDAGISIPEIIEYSQNAVAYGYIANSISYFRLLQGEARPNEFQVLLDLFYRIRALAKANDNPNLLHSDPHPDNFLYVPGQNLAIPIDPSYMPKPGKSFEEVDARLNLTFLYKLFDLQIENDTLRTYISSFVERLEPSEARKMLQYNTKKAEKYNRGPAIYAVVYFGLREFIVSSLRDRPKRSLAGILDRDKDNLNLVSEMLERKAA